MKTLRWILLIPAFIIYICIGGAVCKLLVNVGKGWTDSIFGYSFMTVPILLYVIGLHFVLKKIAPNLLIGARILLVPNLIIYGFAYAKTGFNLPWTTLTLDALTILVLAVDSFSENGIEEFMK